MPHRKAPPVVNDDPEMAGQRARTDSGSLRRKRADTHVGTVEEQHHRDFGVRSDMHLETLLERENVASLSGLLKKKPRR